MVNDIQSSAITTQQNTTCDEGMACWDIARERNNYFMGKFMTARDAKQEQHYHMSHQRAHNRLLHGWGVFCGLQAEKHPDPQCRERWIKISPGVALDCCGRDIYVDDPVYLELPLPIATKGIAGEAASAAPNQRSEIMTGDFFVILQYHEDMVERVPALYNQPHKEEPQFHDNRYREGWKIGFRKIGELPDCWPSKANTQASCVNDCEDTKTGARNSCIEPACVCDGVPLAWIHLIYEDVDGKHAFTKWEIQMEGRQTLPTPSHLLTRIVDINWNHGRDTDVKDLEPENTDDGTEGYWLTVKFNRRLKAIDDDHANGWGVNKFTMLVDYEPDDGPRVPIYDIDDRIVEVLPGETCDSARFYLDKRKLDGISNVLGTWIYVTLKCDYILDCHGNPIDSRNYLDTYLSTGIAKAGGVFESWFRLVGYVREDIRKGRGPKARGL